MLNQAELIIAQESLEKKYNKKQRRKLLKGLFKELTNNPLEQEILGLLVTHQALILNTILEMMLEREDLDESKLELSEVTISLLEKDLVDARIIEYADGRKDIKLFSKFSVTDELRKQLNSFKSLPPMLVKPLQVSPKGNNRGSGYLTIQNDSLILRNPQINHHEGDICSELLNTFNNVEFTINKTIAMHARNEWKDLNQQKPNETYSEYQERLKNFYRFQEGAYETIKEIVEFGNKFYFTHKYDKRGRVYPTAYHINYQGNDFAKAIVELSNKEVITDEVYF